MCSEGRVKKAGIVVDMQKDNAGRFCKGIISNNKRLIEKARDKGILVVYARDSK